MVRIRFLAAAVDTAGSQPDTHQATTSDRTAASLQARLVDVLDLEAFPRRGYRRARYLTAALDAGFTPADLATAHEVSERSIYRAIAVHDDVEWQRPPTTGPAKTLWELDPSAVPGESK